MKRITIATIVVLATLGGLVLVWQFWQAFVLFFLSLAVAAVARPATDYWVNRGLSRVLALVLTYVIGLGLLVGLLVFVGPVLLRELTDVTDRFAGSYEEIVRTWPEGTPFQQSIAERLPPPSVLYRAMAGERGVHIFQTIFGVAQGFFNLVAQLGIVLVLSIYWSADQVRFERLWLSALPGSQRARARSIWRAIEQGVGAYIRSELFQSLLAGFLLASGYWLMGIPYPFTLALIGALLWLIPWVGAVMALILPLISGLSISLGMGIAAAVYTLSVLIVLEVAVEPRLFNRRRYSSLLIVLFVIALADVFGLIGLIVAPPLAAATQILLTSLVRSSAPVESVNPKTQVAQLEARLLRLEAEINLSEEPPPPDVLNLIDRLKTIIDESEGLFDTLEETQPTLDLPLAIGARK